MPGARKEDWQRLLSFLRPELPPPELSMYVRPKRAAGHDVFLTFQEEPEARQKFLLVGARGGGKSTERRP